MAAEKKSGRSRVLASDVGRQVSQSLYCAVTPVAQYRTLQPQCLKSKCQRHGPTSLVLNRHDLVVQLLLQLKIKRRGPSRTEQAARAVRSFAAACFEHKLSGLSHRVAEQGSLFRSFLFWRAPFSPFARLPPRHSLFIRRRDGNPS